MDEITQGQRSGSFIRAVVTTGLIAGTLDIIGAIVNFMVNGGKDPLIIFQYIASAVFGKAAFDGSAGPMIAGFLLHYLIAFIFTLFFFLLFPKIKLLQSRTIPVAIVYGIFVWVIMNKIVLPLTRLDPVSFDIMKASVAALILIICIGLPIAIGAKQYYRKLA